MKKPAEILEEFQLKLKNIPDKKLRVKEITEFSVVYGDCFGWELIPLLEEGIETARANGDQSGEVLCFCNLAFMNRVNGLEAPAKYSISLEKLTEMVEALEHDSDAYALGLNM